MNRLPPVVLTRAYSTETLQTLLSLGLPNWLAKVVAGRLEQDREWTANDLEKIVRPALKHLPAPSLLADVQVAAERIADAIEQGETIGVLTDYDVDGITSHAVLVRSLVDWFGCKPEQLKSYIGHRLKDGYGVSDKLTDRILADSPPAIIITADCGSSDEARIARLKAVGIDVLVTDHHAIPESGIPQSALAVVNPTRDDCAYPDKFVAGVMVAFLLMCVVRQTLINRGRLNADAPRLTRLLEFCALGTVADAVSLQSAVNRAVVNAGLREMNQLQRPCWRAMVQLLDRDSAAFEVDDLGFQLGPRINARSRMSDPHAARRYLLAESEREAKLELKLLDNDNQDRKQVEREMVLEARALAAPQAKEQNVLVVYHPKFYAGVQGIVASRLLDWFGKPAVVLSPTPVAGELSGSARSIAGINIRDALAIAASNPEVGMVRFGGHKAAAGLTMAESGLKALTQSLNDAVNQQVDGRELVPQLETDGPLDPALVSLATWQELESLHPFGRGWPRPSFTGTFEVLQMKAVGADPIHLSLSFDVAGKTVRGIWFSALTEAGAALPFNEGELVEVVYELQRNVFRGNSSLQLQVLSAKAK